MGFPLEILQKANSSSKNGNRRTANVRSVGYTDLFVLNKNDLWNALREYPDARKLLLAKGRELLKKDNLLDENAPEEQQTVEELAEQLTNSVKVLQTRSVLKYKRKIGYGTSDQHCGYAWWHILTSESRLGHIKGVPISRNHE
ncbi:hypothetical protein ANCCAN_10179 [Ancylostoma caninum]|uniref:Cyclic nucleotide-gated channel C-terminal leucine zipper domain-containing protein n=1 Tax=Ancylostoma caninum TaxID=29170 RepID=A0A368GHJ5_ANCCA|nr:hypothetical protein ANCCAN_10179 [Ancylostoma caninum]